MRSWQDEIQRRKNQALLRTRRVLESPQGTTVTLGGQPYLSFCSNDYLGLANHPDVVRALCDGAQRYGVGSGAAHLVTGHSIAHQALEEELAEFTGRERALLFSTGYMANLGVIAALADRNSCVLEDRLNHASLLDGALLSQAQLRRYAHTDVNALAQRLVDAEAKDRVVVTDGVFSMDGDIAPLPSLSEACRAHGALLMVDDAHGLGVIGPEGRGTVAHYGLGSSDVPVLIGTLGKAFGTFGAFVAGDADLIELMIQTARTYIYTTALPPALAEATRVSVRIAQHESWRREHLQTLIQRFRTGAAHLGLQLARSTTPIQPLIVGDAGRCVALSEALQARGILISAIRPPTVPQGSSRLRITFSAAHSEADIDRLLDSLARLVPAHVNPTPTAIDAGDSQQ